MVADGPCEMVGSGHCPISCPCLCHRGRPGMVLVWRPAPAATLVDPAMTDSPLSDSSQSDDEPFAHVLAINETPNHRPAGGGAGGAEEDRYLLVIPSGPPPTAAGDAPQPGGGPEPEGERAGGPDAIPMPKPPRRQKSAGRTSPDSAPRPPSLDIAPRPPSQDSAPRPPSQDSAPRPPSLDSATRQPSQDSDPRPPSLDSATRPRSQDNAPRPPSLDSAPRPRSQDSAPRLPARLHLSPARLPLPSAVAPQRYSAADMDKFSKCVDHLNLHVRGLGLPARGRTSLLPPSPPVTRSAPPSPKEKHLTHTYDQVDDGVEDCSRNNQYELHLDNTQSRTPKSEDRNSKSWESRFESEPLYQTYRDTVIHRQIKRQTLLRDSSRTSEDSTYESIPLPLDNQRAGSSLWQNLDSVRQSGILDGLSQEERKQQESMFEVLTSEASYLRSLNILIDHFMNSRVVNESIIVRDKKTLFSSIVRVAEVSESFLKELEERVDENIKITDICDIIHHHAEHHFLVYIDYVRNQFYQEQKYSQLMEENAQFAAAVVRLQEFPQCQRLPLMSFLLLPFQRITRIKMLIENILHRSAVGSPNEETASKALGVVSKIIEDCNKEVGIMKQMEEMINIMKKLEFDKLKSMFEVLTSEASYLRSLNILIDHFMNSRVVNESIIVRDKKTLFSSIVRVAEVSESFLKELEERVDENIKITDICDIIHHHAEHHFLVYIDYVRNQFYQEQKYSQLMEENAQFAAAVVRLQEFPQCQRLPLMSFLLLPFQRITRIKMLIENILHRSAVGSPNEETASKALGVVSKAPAWDLGPQVAVIE
ncbi:uncharacterized protein LOC144609302 [Rhinoraja longicauda]